MLHFLSYEDFLLRENKQLELKTFLIDKKFINDKSKVFLYHGTSKKPSNFVLSDDYEGEDGNTYNGDLPEGYLFLTSSIKEASAYGQYVIPCELEYYDNICFDVKADDPSIVFDRDYGIDLYKNSEEYRFWEQYEESGKNVLRIKGTDKSTYITPYSNVIPRIDLAKEFYILK